jgi:CheY-like chemotaxis protein
MKARILIVEDNHTNQELLIDWLAVEDYEVVSAETLEQGFAAFKEKPPDAVLLDIQLGPDDGLSLAKWIRQDPKLSYIPIIAVTAHAMVTDRERVIQGGCNACISKPIDFKVLREQLTQWLDYAASARLAP